MGGNIGGRGVRGLLETHAPSAVTLIRLAVATVFVSEGVQKFLFPAALGAGRFAKIGIPAPEVMGPLIGVVETACGALVLVGLFTRLAALLLIANMTVAILSTKVPILIGHGYWRFAAPTGKTGLWGMLHEARTDFAMWLSCAFLLIVGAGPSSLDARVGGRQGGG
jgi:uncharacterized membrane protein YphA (DoxX/SURF4 family)